MFLFLFFLNKSEIQVEHLNILPETLVRVALPLTAWAWSKWLALSLEELSNATLSPQVPCQPLIFLSMPPATALSQVLTSLLGDKGRLIVPLISSCLFLTFIELANWSQSLGPTEHGPPSHAEA